MNEVPDSLALATAKAARVADQAGVQIRMLNDLAEQSKARQLFDLTWSTAGETQVTSNLMRALVHSGSYLSGAFLEDRLVGAAFAFPGRDSTGHWHLHSHMAAVLGEVRDRRIGTALKWHQRAWALENGYDTITWTFDPLVRRNAKLNLLKLGVFVSEYYEDFYGDMEDALNAGDATDRVMARWELRSDRTLRAAAAPAGLDPDPVPDGAVPAILIQHGQPIGSPITPSSDVFLVLQPPDIIEVRKADPALAAAWRKAVRSVLSPALARGMEITGFTSDGSYIVERVWL